MEGRGPTGGKPRRTDLVVVGRNPVATDSVAARIMGIKPESVPNLKRASNRGLGRLDGIDVLGENVKQVARFDSIPTYVSAIFALEDWLQRLGYGLRSLGKLGHMIGAFFYEPAVYLEVIRTSPFPEIMRKAKLFQQTQE